MWQSGLCDWALRRLLKALLKRHSKHVLATELDVEQLRVSLGRGALELRDVLLSREWLAEKAPSGVEFVSGYVGRLSLDLAVTSLTCTVQLEDVLLTVRPCAFTCGSAAGASGDGGSGSPVGSATQQAVDEVRNAVGGRLVSGMDDGLRQVAAGLETLLQRMTITLNRLSIRVEGAAGGSGSPVARLMCKQLSCGGMGAAGLDQEQQQACQTASVARHMCFSGLTFVTEGSGASLLAPLKGTLDVTVSWPLDQGPGHQPHVLVVASLEGALLQLRPCDVHILSGLASDFNAANRAAQRQRQQKQHQIEAMPPIGKVNMAAVRGGGGSLPPSMQHQFQPVRQPPYQSPTSSFLEELMLPGCEEVVHEALVASAPSGTGQTVEEFFDAKSLLGSLQQAFSSAMAASVDPTASEPSNAGAEPGVGSGGGGVGLPQPADIFAMHDLAASIRQGAARQQKQWSIKLSSPSLTLALLYPEVEAETRGSLAGPIYVPRLVAEALDLTATADVESTHVSGDWSSSLSLTVEALEVAEHLSFPNTSPASISTSNSSATSSWVPAEEMARVPGVLPPSPNHVPWAMPTCAGDYPLPDEASAGMSIAATLAQLSNLSQATVYQSTRATIESSLLEESIACQEVTALPRVQIVPVLCCRGQAGAGLLLHCSNPHAALRTRGQPGVGLIADATLLLQPVSIWCTLTLMEHLQSFMAAVVMPPASAVAASPLAPAVDLTDGSRQGVEAAVSASLQNQHSSHQESRVPHFDAQEEQAVPALPLRLHVHLPAACIIAAIPEATTTTPVSQPLPKYFALVVQSRTYQLLASMAPRIGNQKPQALISSLRDSGVQPTFAVQPSSSRCCYNGTGDNTVPFANVSHSWTGAVHMDSAVVHAVAAACTQLGPGESLLGPGLASMQVAITTGEIMAAQSCITIDATWRASITAPKNNILDSLWASAQSNTAAGCKLEESVLQEKLISDARLLVAVSSRAPLLLNLEPGVLAAAGNLVDSLLQLSSAAPPVDTATQAVLLVDCEVQCSLVALSGPPFNFSAQSVSVVACSGISGVAGSSFMTMSIGSIQMTHPDSLGHSRLLLHIAGRQKEDGECPPAAQFVAVLRPTGDACKLCSNGRYILPCQGRISVCTSGLTVMLDEAGQVAWLDDAWELLAGASSGGRSCTTDQGPECSQQGAMPVLLSPPVPAIDWAVRCSCTALRYEPQDTSFAAMVLTVASIVWESRQGQEGSRINAQRLAVHLAGAADSSHTNSSRSHKSAKECNTGLAASETSKRAVAADVAGFHQVAAEAGITIQLPAAGQLAETQATIAAQHATLVPQVVITNKGLNVALSRCTLNLLERVLRQLQSCRCSKISSSGIALGSMNNTSTPDCQQNHQPRNLSRKCAHASGMVGPGDGQQGTAVNLMQCVVPSAYASPSRVVECAHEASVFLDGGWYDAHQSASSHPYVMSPAGSPPTLKQSFVEVFAGHRPGAAQEEQGVWYDSSAPGCNSGSELLEDYIAVAGPGDNELITSFGSPNYNCLRLPPIHPFPQRRIKLHDISITVTLADTFATVLLPEDNEVADLGAVALCHDPSPIRQPRQKLGCITADRSNAHTGGGGDVAGNDGEEEMVPLSAQVQARLEGVCLQVDSFAEQQGMSHQDVGGEIAPSLRCRYALAVHNLEIRDSFQPRQGGAKPSAAAAAAIGWPDLRRMLGYHASAQHARDGQASMLQLVVEAISAEPGTEVEYRMQVQMLPLLLHLDQAALAFLQHFFAPANNEREEVNRSITSQTGGELFFQRCEVQPFTLTINYRPHHVDLAALSSGQLSEVLNLVPWGGVNLQFRHLRLFGMQGLAGVGTALASAYIEDIARFQAHRFVGGLAPIKSICRVSTAAAQLVAIPKQHLYKQSIGGVGGSLSLTSMVDEDFRRQMQRGLAGFVRAVALEALNLGATVAASAEVALGGESSASHTAGMKQALRQASTHLRSSSSGPRSSAHAAATAVRTALLGVRNTLDKDHALERRLNS